ELLGALDAELARLPERLQLPLALCYWHGLSRAEAARRLGWTAAALHGRLERGRAALALRLRARGLGPPLVLAPLAAAAVPARLGGDRWRHEGEAQSVAFSADGKTLAVLSTGDNTVSFLETATGKRLGRLAVPRVDWRGGRTIAFSPDGAVFAYQVGGGAVHLFDARTRRPLRVLTPAAEDFEAGIPAPIRFS